jgi:pimeloyl-ACP methyl ester carboxylesterase
MDNRTNGKEGNPATPRQRLTPIIGVTSLIAFIGLCLAYLAYMRRYVLHDVPLTGALSGRLGSCSSSVGHLGFYMAHRERHHSLFTTPVSAPPLLLLHSINAAASSYEVKPLFEYYARERSVYAMDLPGFGFSERGERRYTPKLYRDAINDFIATELHGTAVDAVALSLSAEFLALAAARRPEQFRSLTFITPTGMSRHDTQRRPNDAFLRMLLNPTWGRVFFDTITSRAGLQVSLGPLQKQPLDRGLLHYAYVSSHQPDAQYAPFYLLAGRLATPSIYDVYQSLTQPVLVISGQNSSARFDLAEALHARPNWRFAEFKQCGDLVHFDDPAGVIARLNQQLKDVRP